MTEELVPGSVETSGTLLVLIVPKSGVANPTAPTLAELNATTVKRITYSLTESGWSPSTTEETIPDNRLTLPQVLTRPGRVTRGLDIQYTFGAEDDVASPLLVKGFEGHVYSRYAIANELDIAADQQFDEYPFVAGVQRKDPPAANGVWTKTQTLHPRGVAHDDVAVVAA